MRSIVADLILNTALACDAHGVVFPHNLLTGVSVLPRKSSVVPKCHEFQASSSLNEAEFREYAELLHRSKHGELPLKELLHKLMELFGPRRKHLLTSEFFS